MTVYDEPTTEQGEQLRKEAIVGIWDRRPEVAIPRALLQLRQIILDEQGPEPAWDQETPWKQWSPVFDDYLKKPTALKVGADRFPEEITDMVSRLKRLLNTNPDSPWFTNTATREELVQRIEEYYDTGEDFDPTFCQTLMYDCPPVLGLRVLQTLGAVSQDTDMADLTSGAVGEPFNADYEQGIEQLPLGVCPKDGVTLGIKWKKNHPEKLELFVDFTPEWMARRIRPDLFEPENREPLQENPEVIWSEGHGRMKNMATVLESHLRANPDFWKGLAGKTVLVKPNMVNPEHPAANTDPEALFILLAFLKNNGVGRILIGDQPAVGSLEHLAKEGKTVRDMYKKLRYEEAVSQMERLGGKSPKVEFVDFSKIKTEPLGEISLPTISIDGLAAIFNLVHPKEHGQFYFSCAAKSLMGLVPAEDRIAYFHPDHHTPADLVQEIATQWTTDGKLTSMTQENAAKMNADIYIEAARRTEPAHMLAMANFAVAFTRYWAESGVPILTVADGTNMLKEHEHFGRPEDLNIAAIGSNPLAVDLAVVRKLGLQLGANHYLTLLARELKVTPKVSGDTLVARRQYHLHQTHRNAVVTDDGRITYDFVVENVK